MLEPLGYEKVIVPPCPIVACVDELPLSSHAKSTAVNDALPGGELLAASDGSATTAAPASPASGRRNTRNLMRLPLGPRRRELPSRTRHPLF
jgi:hypothetical protein